MSQRATFGGDGSTLTPPLMVLADFDNLRRGSVASHKDVEDIVDSLIERLGIWVGQYMDSVREVDIRLYGGWRTMGGQATTRADWAEAACADFRGLRGGRRFRPSLATNLLQIPNLHMNGTVRKRGGRQVQKMVDMMMGLDVVHACNSIRLSTVVVSNDEDLTPAIAIAGRRAHWYRIGRQADACNDPRLRALGVLIENSEGI